MNVETILGIDLGGTDCKFGIVDTSGKVVHKEKHPTRTELGPEGVIDLMAEHVLSIATRHRFGIVGLGAPGPLSTREGIIFEAPNLGPLFNNVPIQKMLEDRLSMPVLLSNDANAAAYGEFWTGAGREVQNLILFTLGTGVGGGIILNGELYAGVDDTAGEVGHMIIDLNGPLCNCGNHGCLEAIASATAVKRMVREALAAGVKTSIVLPEGEDEEFGAKNVFEAAENGDAFAKEVFQKVGNALGIAAATMINLLNPEMIAYSGAMANAGEYIFRPLREAAKANSFAKPFERVQIKHAELGADAGIIGAAGLAVRRRANVQSAE